MTVNFQGSITALLLWVGYHLRNRDLKELNGMDAFETSRILGKKGPSSLASTSQDLACLFEAAKGRMRAQIVLIARRVPGEEPAKGPFG